jgi:hypothetical protein
MDNSGGVDLFNNWSISGESRPWSIRLAYVRELTQFAHAPTEGHYLAMIRCMRYCVDTKDKGFVIKPNRMWDERNKDFEFEISGYSDSDYRKAADCKSISGYMACLEGVPYTRACKAQKYVTMSVTEAECDAAVSCIQDMIFGKNVLESMGLKVKLPMVLYMDNSGGVDLFNNWSISGESRPWSIRLAYVRELKEQGIIDVFWISTNKNPSDILTKNLDTATFEQHASLFHTGSHEATSTSINDDKG